MEVLRLQRLSLEGEVQKYMAAFREGEREHEHLVQQIKVCRLHGSPAVPAFMHVLCPLACMHMRVCTRMCACSDIPATNVSLSHVYMQMLENQAAQKGHCTAPVPLAQGKVPVQALPGVPVQML
jgi:hypothetical protein